jgi:predicted metal-dependent HD superfamily phosphohydrolase
MTLKMYWDPLAGRLGILPALSEPVHLALLACYGSRERHYHNLNHLAALLEEIAQQPDAWQDRDSAELAAWFHDAVYDPLRPDNEAQSARMAAAQLASWGLPPAQLARVQRLILATRHLDEAPEDPDEALLRDLDLSVLGGTHEAYQAYAGAIRREYSMVPEPAYRAGRSQVLAAFLARAAIYRTQACHDRYEAAARQNLAWELGTLR